jgi:hypothetical protein
MNKVIGRSFSSLVLAVVLGWAPSTLAQKGGFSLDRFQPSLPGDRFFGVEGGDPGGHLSASADASGRLRLSPVVPVQRAGRRAGWRLVKNQLLVHVAAGVTLWDRLLVAADMPLTLVNKGQTRPCSITEQVAVGRGCRRSAPERTRAAGGRSALGGQPEPGRACVRAHRKQDKFTGEGKVHGMPVLVFSGELPFLAYSATAGVDIRGKTSFGGTDNVTLGTQLFSAPRSGFCWPTRCCRLGPRSMERL